jgi:hypothetical protein
MLTSRVKSYSQFAGASIGTCAAITTIGANDPNIALWIFPVFLTLLSKTTLS